MKTSGEIEAGVCQGMSRFEQEYMGRGPKDVHVPISRRSKREVHPEFQIIGVILCLVLITILR